MPSNVQTRIQNSWQKLADDSAQVIATRLALLPWQWIMQPVNAQEETQRMFSEKHDAMLETQWAILQAPVNFWLDAIKHGFAYNPQAAMSEATSEASIRLLEPSTSRVRANRKRLASN